MPKNKPKWMTDKTWALRRSNKKGRLPEEVELIFLGDPEFCFRYAEAIGTKLPDNLENSVCEKLEADQENHDRTIVNWIISYKQSIGEITARMQDILVTRLKSHVGSRYDWGVERALKYASLCNNEIPEDLERAIWSNEYSAFKYAMQSGRRIPADLEPEILSKFFDEDEVASYSRRMFNGRLPPELERLLADMPDAALVYAKEIIIGRLPEELHTAMIMKSFENNKGVGQTVSEYLDFVKSTYNYTRSTLANFDKNTTVEEVLKSIGENIEYSKNDI
jgi:hypothetical protein